ncbi:hypothetical protein [Paenibacillus sp. USDA918EY]|uniref:Uncharacterized protein n=1 Tax=Paenibacillus albilobatus TaxID=2716884 RepID=A0A919XHJ2_9BACL|nr:hypothetical protein [Paenibacillus sp. USDA918EY]GIO31844.1 hypothetical protein J2TS6_29850 [Paenibacillus albilobatus]
MEKNTSSRFLGSVRGAHDEWYEKNTTERQFLWYNMVVHTHLEWTHPPEGGDAMNISFGEVLTFGLFLLALLTYIDKRK